jgi:hypothetical protein
MKYLFILFISAGIAAFAAYKVDKTYNCSRPNPDGVGCQLLILSLDKEKLRSDRRQAIAIYGPSSYLIMFTLLKIFEQDKKE